MHDETMIVPCVMNYFRSSISKIDKAARTNFALYFSINQ